MARLQRRPYKDLWLPVYRVDVSDHLRDQQPIYRRSTFALTFPPHENRRSAVVIRSIIEKTAKASPTLCLLLTLWICARGWVASRVSRIKTDTPSATFGWLTMPFPEAPMLIRHLGRGERADRSLKGGHGRPSTKSNGDVRVSAAHRRRLSSSL